ncbi:hypothetical protein MKX01_018890 [Papaver californicum]|nr:hypothetical protein MKX01_018890 [Papaver californicum]
MKTTTAFVLLVSSFIFFAFSIQLSVVSATFAAEDYIRDIWKTTPKRNRVLPLDKKLNGTQCPLEVVQEQAEVSSGLPLTFTPVDPKAKINRISTDLNVKSSVMSICVQYMVWRSAEFDEPTEQRFIEMSGVEGSPGPATTSKWFKIEKYGDSNDYKHVFCPSVCNFCRFACKDVGIYIGADGVRRLALVDYDAKPFKIMFKEASSTC